MLWIRRRRRLRSSLLRIFWDTEMRLEKGKVEIVQESLLGIAHVDEGCVEARQDLLHPTQINVTNCKLVVGLFSVKFDKRIVFQKSDVNLRSVRVDDQVARHRLYCHNLLLLFFRHSVFTLGLTI